LTAEECVEALKNQRLRKIDDLPDAVGIYALTDHLGDIHYIGITEANSFRDRIYSRHVNGSEERSHKLACNYNIGRMWRDRKSADHVSRDAQIAKNLRREFIRRHCLAACIPLDYTKQALEALENEIFAIVPPDMISWNATRKRVNCLPEPRDLVDALIDELGLGLEERAALDRQAKRFEKQAGGEYAAARQSPWSAGLEHFRQSLPSARPEDGSKGSRVDSVDVAIPVGRPRGFERIAADGERFLAHCFRDGLYRIADPALGPTKHHAKNQLAVTFEEIGGYLQRGYLLRMRGEVTKHVNLISPSEIKILY
jgi:hypothetical protein